jgi:alpha-glucoside transport system substrate-binding protein
MGKRKAIQRVALAAAVALGASACLSDSGSSGGGGGGGGGKSGDGNVEIVFGFGGSQSAGFKQAFTDWGKTSGIKIKFTEASQSFDTLIRTRVQANNAPDIALFPQPGILKDFVAQNKMTDLSTQLDVNQLQSQLIPGILDAGKVGDKFYGVPISYNVKSLVFYPKKAWAAAGLKPPRTQAELTSLTNQLASQGKKPWCLGIESSSATGWPATDWLEDEMLRTAGPDKYDQWVGHQIPFDDPSVKTAATAFQDLVLNDDHVLGGRKGAVSTNFAAAGNPMFNSTPACWMLKQGNFITQQGFFPDKVVADLDNQVGVFYFPSDNPNTKPVLGGGDLAAVFNGKDDDTKKVMQFMTGSDFPGWSEQGGFLSPRKDWDLGKYKSQVTRDIATVGKSASVLKFDGSDQMPGAVGSGSFWKGMTAWISGQQTLDQALSSIEQSWPS